MIIVSQDKKSIINFDRVTNTWIDDNILDKTNTNFEICADGETLGYYATEERAKEVLEEFIEIYSIIGIEMQQGEGKIRRLPVYEMPKE